MNNDSNQQPPEQQKPDQLREHVFDGIQEYDNLLPRWWVWKFVLTVIFGVGYFYFYELSGRGKGLIESHEETARAIQVQNLIKKDEEAFLGEADLRKLLNDQTRLRAGAAIYATRCASCHGDQAQGLVGPNLTDHFWIHGNQMADIMRTVVEGIPAKGMISWKTLLKRDEIYDVTAFVKSLEGKNAVGKAPEGTEFKTP